jgi:rod shape-determining protein MreD
MRSVLARILLIIPVTLILSILPTPEILTEFRPPWICMLILYLQCFLPRYYNLTIIVILGLCMDVLLSTIMGEHAFALLIFSWIANTKSRRFRFFSIYQQMALIGFYCLIYQSILLSIDTLLGFHYTLWKPLSTSLLAIIFWPWVRLLLDDTLLIIGTKNRKSSLCS